MNPERPRPLSIRMVVAADPGRPQIFSRKPQRYAIVFALLATLSGIRVAVAFEMEFNAVTVEDTFANPNWTQVSFIEPFSVRPIVVVLPTNEGGDPSTIRIRNVTTTGFEVLAVEPNANDGPHVAMTTAYLAVEPGDHRLPDGTQLSAFRHQTRAFVSRNFGSTWDTISFPSGFASPPAVVAQIQGAANESGNPPGTSSIPFLEVAVQNISAGSVRAALERAESPAGSVSADEEIGFIAIENGTDTTFAVAGGSIVHLQAIITPDQIRGWDDGCFNSSWPTAFAGVPLAVASQAARAGNNGGWVRRCAQSAGALGLTVDEDTDSDSERNHTTEPASMIGASSAFHHNFGVFLDISKHVEVISDPVTLATHPKAIPGASLSYRLRVVNQRPASPDTNSLTVVDTLPSALAMCVQPSCFAGAPVRFDATGSPLPPGVNLGTVSYSNDGGSTFDYVPVPDTLGYDGAIDAVRITLSGTMAAASGASFPSFELELRTRLE